MESKYQIIMKDIRRETLSGPNLDAYLNILLDLETALGADNFRASWEIRKIRTDSHYYRSEVLVIYVDSEEEASFVRLRYGY